MVANFQYLVTCMAFSIAKPFRKSIYTNIPFFFCVIFLFIFNTLCIYLPSKNVVPTEFDLLPFESQDGATSNYSYRYWVGLGILVNSILTYGAEKLIVNILTRKYDAKMKLKKQVLF